MKRIFLTAIWVLTIFVFSVSASSAQSPEGIDVSPSVGISPSLAGFASCPALASKEVFFVTYATDNTGIATVISITNLGTKDATIICQFFFGFGSTQAGSDATLILGPGDTGECATRSTDPLGIFFINADAATGAFEGKGRICSSTPTIAADARLSSTAAGLYGINLVKKTQKGD